MYIFQISIELLQHLFSLRKWILDLDETVISFSIILLISPIYFLILFSSFLHYASVIILAISITTICYVLLLVLILIDEDHLRLAVVSTCFNFPYARLKTIQSSADTLPNLACLNFLQFQLPLPHNALVSDPILRSNINDDPPLPILIFSMGQHDLHQGRPQPPKHQLNIPKSPPQFRPHSLVGQAQLVKFDPMGQCT